MKKIRFLTAIMFLSCHIIYGQINTQEEPISFRSNVPNLTKSEKTVKFFAALDMDKIEQEDKEDEKNRIPPRFGYPHEVNYNLDNSGEWVTLKNGDRIWRLIISCQDALSINLVYEKFWIPNGAKFFVYGKDRKQIIGAMTSINNKGEKNNVRGFATGLIHGDQITLEYYLSKNVQETGIISIAKVVHGYRNISKSSRSFGDSGPCQVNINCNEGNNWQNEKNAVALILVEGFRNCSGALINTTANDGRPLFLTANHCLGSGDAVTNPDLSSWSFYWHYESPTCANTIDPPYIPTSSATVIANNSVSDFALLRLEEDPRDAGVTTYYLGWDRSGNPGTGGVGIHHPRGDVKKISTHNRTPQSHWGNNFWFFFWMQTQNGFSVTEGCSSGSPLINNNRHVIGQLYGGSNVNCTNPALDSAMYGKISVSWTSNNNQDNRRRLNYWLDPNNTGILALDGCYGVINYSNPIVIGNTTVTSCGDLNVQSTTVFPGGALNLRANKKVAINPYFSVEAGGELTIQVP
jgi:hypothetical protein